jgi:hypothetical protein
MSFFQIRYCLFVIRICVPWCLYLLLNVFFTCLFQSLSVSSFHLSFSLFKSQLNLFERESKRKNVGYNLNDLFFSSSGWARAVHQEHLHPEHVRLHRRVRRYLLRFRNDAARGLGRVRPRGRPGPHHGLQHQQLRLPLPHQQVERATNFPRLIYCARMLK